MSHSVIPNDSTRPFPMPSPDAELECAICKNVRTFASFDQLTGEGACSECQNAQITAHRRR